MRQIEGDDSVGYDYPEAALESFLTDVFETLLVVLEAAGLPDARARLITTWAEFQKNGIRPRSFRPEDGVDLESPPFEYLSRLIEGLRNSAGEDLKPSDSYELRSLERILQDTAVLVRGRKVNPQGEQDVKLVMRDYLKAFFTMYTDEPKISKPIRNFKPDCGVINLRTAIEFKYAASQNEVARAVAGLFEDVSGYSGSRDWINFYAVIYQTEAFESGVRVRSALTSTGTRTWKAFLVTGLGSRGRRSKSGSKRAVKPVKS